MRRFAKSITILFSFCILLILPTACSDKKSSHAVKKEKLKIDGSSTVYPITAAIVEKYNKQQSDFKILLSVSGTGGGFNKFIDKETEINNASREISPEEIRRCSANQVMFRQFEVAYDGIAVVVNKENTWVDDLTVAELEKIWSRDGASKWSDIKTDWPDEIISLYGPGNESGTHDYFKKVIISKNQAFKEDFRKSENDNLLVTGISNNKFALGFFGLAYYERNKEKLKLVAIDNGNGPVYPSAKTISAQQYTPLSRPMFIYVNETFCQKESGKRFIEFYLKNAASMSSKVGYVPLPEAIYSQAITKI